MASEKHFSITGMQKQFAKLSFKEDNNCKIIFYDDIYKFKKTNSEYRAFDLIKMDEDKISKLKESLFEGLSLVARKDYAVQYPDTVRNCFEISCYILYDRQIMKEVIERQKNYEPDYVVDFFKYVLRIFFRKYKDNPILSRNQCIDIKELCKNILKASNSFEDNSEILNKCSAKDIVEFLYTIPAIK